MSNTPVTSYSHSAHQLNVGSIGATGIDGSATVVKGKTGLPGPHGNTGPSGPTGPPVLILCGKGPDVVYPLVES